MSYSNPYFLCLKGDENYAFAQNFYKYICLKRLTLRRFLSMAASFDFILFSFLIILFCIMSNNGDPFQIRENSRKCTVFLAKKFFLFLFFSGILFEFQHFGSQKRHQRLLFFHAPNLDRRS